MQDSSDKQPDQKSKPDMERLYDWMEAVDGSILSGESELKSVKQSQNGNKLTIVLKKKKRTDGNRSA